MLNGLLTLFLSMLKYILSAETKQNYPIYYFITPPVQLPLNFLAFQKHKVSTP